VLAEIDAYAWPTLPPDLLHAMLRPEAAGERLAAARASVTRQMPATYPPDVKDWLVTGIARRRVARGVFDAVALLDSNPAKLDQIFSDAYIDLFLEQVVPLHDSSLTGDQVVDRVVKSCPPGSIVDIMGIQNIKGTGLDFVYRWVSLDTVERALHKVLSGGEERATGLRELLLHDDYGLIDAAHARDVTTTLSGTLPPAEQAAFRPVLQRLQGLVERKETALSAKAATSFGDGLRAVIGKTFDYLDSMRRQSRAKEVLEHLVAGRISHAAAAVEMRAVVARAKGGWAKRKVDVG